MSSPPNDFKPTPGKLYIPDINYHRQTGHWPVSLCVYASDNRWVKYISWDDGAPLLCLYEINCDPSYTGPYTPDTTRFIFLYHEYHICFMTRFVMPMPPDYLASTSP